MERLPDELLMLTMTFLPSLEILDLRLVNKRWKSAAEIVKMRIYAFLNERYQIRIPEGLHLSADSMLRLTAKSNAYLLGGGSLLEGKSSFLHFNEFDLNRKQWKISAPFSHSHGLIHTEAVADINGIYLIGGDEDNAASASTVEYYCFYTQQWSELPSVPQGLLYSAIAYSANQPLLFVSGGINADARLEYNETLFAYSPELKTWRLLTGNSILRYGHAICVTPYHELLICGGKTTLGCTDLTEYYSVSTNKWVDGPKMNVARMWPKLVVIKNIIYAIGGDITGNGRDLPHTIECLRVGSNKWEMVTEFVQTRRLYSVCVIDTNIVIVGGKDQYFAAMRKNAVFNTYTKTWCGDEMVGLIPRDKFCGGAAVAKPTVTWTDIN